MNLAPAAAPNPAQGVRPRRRWLGLVLLLYLVLAAAYGLVNPLFEAPDEHHHYFVADYIAATGRLPAIGPEPDPLMRQEAAQPPLYYGLGALLIAGIDTGSARSQLWFNPLGQVGDASVLANRNVFVHGPIEAWPWRGYALAAHLLRGFSTLLGLGTLLSLYGAARLVWPTVPERAVLTAALVAFLPQYLFLHASVSNDPLVIFWSTLAIWQLLWFWRRSRPTGRRLLALGATLALAILSKTAGLALFIFAAGFLLVLGWRWRRVTPWAWRRLKRGAWLAASPPLLTAAWLMGRNWRLYGDVTAFNQFVALEGGRSVSLLDVLLETSSLWNSLIAVFGWFNLRTHDGVYWIWNGLILLSLAGALASWWQRRGASPRASDETLLALLLAAWAGLVYGALISFMLRTPAAQGRLLFPALAPMALGLVAGLGAWPRWLGRVAVGLALLTSLAGLMSIARAYAPPPHLASADVPTAARRLERPMADGLVLVAADVPDASFHPGETLWLHFYWRAESRPARAPETVVELLGPGMVILGRQQAYHGGGLYPATLWPRGQIVGERVGLRLVPEAPVPVAARLLVRVVGFEPTVELGPIKVAPRSWPPPVAEPLARFGSAIELAGAALAPGQAQPGDTVTVRLEWQVKASPEAELTTFVHLGPPDEAPLSTGDSPPRQGSYPTRFWAAGERFNDSYDLPVPPGLDPGRYPVWIGLYTAQGARLPVNVTPAGDGTADAYLVGHITVAAGAARP